MWPFVSLLLQYNRLLLDWTIFEIAEIRNKVFMSSFGEKNNSLQFD
jgi:hypothetical protein